MGRRVYLNSLYRGQVYHVFDGDLLLGEVTLPTGGQPTVTAAYTWGANGLVSERLVSQTRSLWYHFGPQGETRQLTNAGGAVVDTYVYTAYGVPVASTGTDPNPFRFGGQVGYYTETNPQCQTVLCGARRYSPVLGRWLSRDPIGYEGGPNLYEYCGGDPVRWVDPSGLDWELIIRASDDHCWIVVRDYAAHTNRTFGRWGYGERGAGVYEGREKGRAYDVERRVIMKTAPLVSRSGGYTPYNNNCTTYAADVWRYNTGEDLPIRFWGILWDHPGALVGSIGDANRRKPRLPSRKSPARAGTGSSNSSSRSSSWCSSSSSGSSIGSFRSSKGSSR